MISFQANGNLDENQTELSRLEAEAQQAVIDAEKAFKKAAKAQAKARNAEQDASALGIPKETDTESSSDGK